MSVLRHDGEITSAFLDFHRSCPGWDHNWPATGEGNTEDPLADFPSDSRSESDGKSASVGSAVFR